MNRLAIVISHPIQYYSPLFHLLSSRGNVAIKVFYTWGVKSRSKYDPGFGKQIEWDIPLLEGYDYEFLNNTANDPGTHHFRGIINPDGIERIRKYAPDAILIYGWGFQSHFKIMRYFKGKVPVWFRGDSTLLDPGSAIKAALRWTWLKWVYRHVDKAFYAGLANKQYFLNYGLKESQLVFVPHAVDNDRFSEDRKAEATALRIQLGIPENSILVLFAGKFEEKKSPLLLLKAFKALGRKDIHLLFTGNGPLGEALKNEASSQPNIHFHDFVNQFYMPVHFQASDLFCLPSQGPGETWGLAVNEAMAAGNAILVSDRVGCGVDLVKDGQNGMVFEAGNERALLAALQELLADAGVLAQKGLNSKEIIKNYTFRQQVAAIEGQKLMIRS